MVDPASTRKLAVLFADVSGSTTLYEKLGDRAALAAVESVLEILKRAVASNRGRVVKTIGDEVMAVFDTADAAFQAAVDMQTHTDELPAINEVKLGIRIGFHAGPVLEERATCSATRSTPPRAWRASPSRARSSPAGRPWTRCRRRCAKARATSTRCR